MKSSFCGNGGCVDVKFTKYGVYLVDADGDSVSYTYDEWRAFIKGVCAGEFDV